MDGMPPSSTPIAGVASASSSQTQVAPSPAATLVGTSSAAPAGNPSPEAQTDQFISVLKALVTDPSAAANPAQQNQFGMLLLKKMTEFIQLEQQNRIRPDQLDTLKEMARTFAPRVVQAAAQARQQQQAAQQQAAAARNQTPTSTGSGVPVQRFEAPKWEALDTAIIFAPPSNLPVPNHGFSIPPPYTQNPPPSFNLHLPPRLSLPGNNAASQAAASPPTEQMPQSEMFPLSEKLSDDVVNWERMVEDHEGRTVVEPYKWRNDRGGAPRPTLNLGLADGLGGSLLGTAPLLAPPASSSYVMPYSAAGSMSADSDPLHARTIPELLHALQPDMDVQPAAESFLLSEADEFIDSVTRFACDMALARGADTLDTRDLQLHLERNLNIRIPGFASDEIRLALSHAITGTGKVKDGGGASGRGVRAARLAAVGR